MALHARSLDFSLDSLTSLSSTQLALAHLHPDYSDSLHPSIFRQWFRLRERARNKLARDENAALSDEEQFALLPLDHSLEPAALNSLTDEQLLAVQFHPEAGDIAVLKAEVILRKRREKAAAAAAKAVREREASREASRGRTGTPASGPAAQNGKVEDVKPAQAEVVAAQEQGRRPTPAHSNVPASTPAPPATPAVAPIAAAPPGSTPPRPNKRPRTPSPPVELPPLPHKREKLSLDLRALLHALKLSNLPCKDISTRASLAALFPPDVKPDASILFQPRTKDDFAREAKVGFLDFEKRTEAMQEMLKVRIGRWDIHPELVEDGSKVDWEWGDLEYEAQQALWRVECGVEPRKKQRSEGEEAPTMPVEVLRGQQGAEESPVDGVPIVEDDEEDDEEGALVAPSDSESPEVPLVPLPMQLDDPPPAAQPILEAGTPPFPPPSALAPAPPPPPHPPARSPSPARSESSAVSLGRPDRSTPPLPSQPASRPSSALSASLLDRLDPPQPAEVLVVEDDDGKSEAYTLAPALSSHSHPLVTRPASPPPPFASTSTAASARPPPRRTPSSSSSQPQPQSRPSPHTAQSTPTLLARTTKLTVHGRSGGEAVETSANGNGGGKGRAVRPLAKRQASGSGGGAANGAASSLLDRVGESRGSPASDRGGESSFSPAGSREASIASDASGPASQTGKKGRRKSEANGNGDGGGAGGSGNHPVQGAGKAGRVRGGLAMGVQPALSHAAKNQGGGSSSSSSAAAPGPTAPRTKGKGPPPVLIPSGASHSASDTSTATGRHPCTYFLQGRCTNGDQCRYPHVHPPGGVPVTSGKGGKAGGQGSGGGPAKKGGGSEARPSPHRQNSGSSSVGSASASTAAPTLLSRFSNSGAPVAAHKPPPSKQAGGGSGKKGGPSLASRMGGGGGSGSTKGGQHQGGGGKGGGGGGGAGLLGRLS
ncbi:hypothetical protein JCM8097_003534 [Rhodosporidiobolus ruineniae]